MFLILNCKIWNGSKLKQNSSKCFNLKSFSFQSFKYNNTKGKYRDCTSVCML